MSHIKVDRGSITEQSVRVFNVIYNTSTLVGGGDVLLDLFSCGFVMRYKLVILYPTLNLDIIKTSFERIREDFLGNHLLMPFLHVEQAN